MLSRAWGRGGTAADDRPGRCAVKPHKCMSDGMKVCTLYDDPFRP